VATRAQANRARAAHAEALARKGAHAVGVEDGKSFGKQGFVVVAYVEPGKKVDMPATINPEATEIEVPLVVERAEMFKAE
jgi:hypothetical protein